MRLYAKIGTGSGCYYDFRLNDWTRPPPELLKAPEVGTLVAWQERKNGKWETGRVTEIRDVGHNYLHLIERF